MAIRIPTSDQSKIFIGSQEIGAVYVGANKVWPDAPVIDPDAFIMRISVSAGQTVTIPFFNTGTYSGTINWKDGTTSTITSYNDTRRIHTYSTAGTYDIEFIGSFPQIYFNGSGSRLEVKAIIQWGNAGIIDLTSSFRKCSNLSLLPVYCAPQLSMVGNYAYYQCTSLTEVNMPPSVTMLGNSCFFGCSSLSTVHLGNVSSFGYSAFSRCSSLSSITLTSSVTTIPDECFFGCASLGSMTIPSSVTNIGTYAFGNCGSTIFYVNPTTPPTINSFTFYGGTGQIRVPEASVAAYKAAAGWSAYASRIVAQ